MPFQYLQFIGLTLSTSQRSREGFQFHVTTDAEDIHNRCEIIEHALSEIFSSSKFQATLNPPFKIQGRLIELSVYFQGFISHCEWGFDAFQPLL